MNETLILGNGYIGSALSFSLTEAQYTHSSPEKATQNTAIYFNLSDPGSWKNIPAAKTVIWTFPAAPVELVEAFYQNHLKNCENLLVYASTSCYQFSGLDSLVTEQNHLDYQKPRVAGEEYLRQQNAAILVLSGIYGPQREPVNWLRKGRIRSFDKVVNLIHRDDIIEITRYLLENKCFPTGERLNISDGVYRRWSEIAEHYAIQDAPISNQQISNSKLVSNDKLRHLLPETFQFRTLY